jgi:hypothetical protein
MGKRELLLVAAFVLAGALVYHVTAPPPAAGERSFSFSQIFEHVRRVVRGNRASAEATTITTHPVDPSVAELKVSAGGEIAIVGEDRTDIEAELRVHSNGFDEDEAQQLVKATVLKVETAGSTLAASVSYPQAGTQRLLNLRLKIPARLLVRLEGNAASLTVTGVAGVETASRSEARISKIAGRVSGTHRGGELSVSDSGSVRLTTINTDVRLEHIAGEVGLNMRGGELKASELTGPIDLDTSGTDVTLGKLEKVTGLVRINANGGSVTLNGLRSEGRIDVRNAEVQAVIDRAAPFAIYSEGGRPVDITSPPGGYQLDALARNAHVTVPDDTLKIASAGTEQRATGPIAGGGPTITVRTDRGDITVRNR